MKKFKLRLILKKFSKYEKLFLEDIIILMSQNISKILPYRYTYHISMENSNINIW